MKDADSLLRKSAEKNHTAGEKMQEAVDLMDYAIRRMRLSRYHLKRAREIYKDSKENGRGERL
jgi:hypothetical protein